MDKPRVALMVDPNDEYFGQMGKVITEGSVKKIEFSGGKSEGKIVTASPAKSEQIPLILIWPEEEQILTHRLPPLAIKYRATIGRLLELNSDVTVPERVRQAVREEFTYIFRDWYDYHINYLMAAVKGRIKGKVDWSEANPRSS